MKALRELLLLLSGLGGIAYQQVTGNVNFELLMVYCLMLGLLSASMLQRMYPGRNSPPAESTVEPPAPASPPKPDPRPRRDDDNQTGMAALVRDGLAALVLLWLAVKAVISRFRRPQAAASSATAVVLTSATAALAGAVIYATLHTKPPHDVVLPKPVIASSTARPPTPTPAPPTPSATTPAPLPSPSPPAGSSSPAAPVAPPTSRPKVIPNPAPSPAPAIHPSPSPSPGRTCLFTVDGARCQNPEGLIRNGKIPVGQTRTKPSHSATFMKWLMSMF